MWTFSTAPRRPATRSPEVRYAQNRFSVTRQLRYSNDERQRALDLALFINGLPIATFELKNSLTKQTVERRCPAVPEHPQRTREDLFHVGHGAPSTSQWTRMKSSSAPSSPVKPPSSCRSTRAMTKAAPATPSTRTGSRRTTSGENLLTPTSLTDIIENYTQKVGDEQDLAPLPPA